MATVTQDHLTFLGEAKTAFENNEKLKTYRDENDSIIALRVDSGTYKDNIIMFNLDVKVANFVNIIKKGDK